MEVGKTTPMISVLMPVYNVKEYLHMAIDSILNQTFTNFELIIINDGSTDGSGVIAEEYQKKDLRVKVYHIENSGLANVRNLALSYARGKYITFVDSDDAVSEEYLECLYTYSVQYDADISVCSYYKYVENEKLYYFINLEEGYEVKRFTGREVYQNYYNPINSYNIIFAVAWGKLIKRELFRTLHFPSGKIHEDSFTVYKLFLLTDKIIYVNKALYMYRQHSNSIMSNPWSRERIINSIEQHEERMSLLSVLGIAITESNKEDYIATLRNCAMIALDNGYIDVYKMVKQKLDLIEEYRSKHSL